MRNRIYHHHHHRISRNFSTWTKKKTIRDNSEFVNEQIQVNQRQRIQPPRGHNESIRQQLEHLNNQLLSGAISEDEYIRQFRIIQMSI